MFFFPNFKIFGTRFVKSNKEESQPIVYTLTEGEVYNIVANTQTFDIEIIENRDSSDMSLTYVDGKWGFANVPASNLTIKDNGNTIEARMLETSGWMFGTGTLKISLPINANINLNINTNSGDIHINNGKLKSLAINMTDGDLVWKAEQEKVEETPTPASDTNEDSTAEDNTTETPAPEMIPLSNLTIEAISIFSKKANIDLSCFDTLTVNNKFLINANKLKLELQSLNANTHINCPNLELNIANLTDTNELLIFSKSGSIKIDTLQCLDKATIITKSATISIKNIDCLTYLSTETGNISVTNVNNNTTLNTNSGNVNITKGNEDINITTTSGSITVNEYYNSADITTKTGNITINNMGTESSGRDTKIVQDSGNITFVTLANEMRIRSNNGSNIRGTFRQMCLNENIQHYINNINGESTLYIMMDQHPFRVRATGEVDGELGNIVNMTATSEYIMYTPDNDHNTYSDVASINVEGGKIHFAGIYE